MLPRTPGLFVLSCEFLHQLVHFLFLPRQRAHQWQFCLGNLLELKLYIHCSRQGGDA